MVMRLFIVDRASYFYKAFLLYLDSLLMQLDYIVNVFELNFFFSSEKWPFLHFSLFSFLQVLLSKVNFNILILDNLKRIIKGQCAIYRVFTISI
jgi:hypothetical protein